MVNKKSPKLYRKLRITLKKIRITLKKNNLLKNKKLTPKQQRAIVIQSKAEKLLSEMRSDWNYDFTLEDEAMVFRKMVSIWIEEQNKKFNENELENQRIKNATKDMYFV